MFPTTCDDPFPRFCVDNMDSHERVTFEWCYSIPSSCTVTLFEEFERQLFAPLLRKAFAYGMVLVDLTKESVHEWRHNYTLVLGLGTERRVFSCLSDYARRMVDLSLKDAPLPDIRQRYQDLPSVSSFRSHTPSLDSWDDGSTNTQKGEKVWEEIFQVRSSGSKPLGVGHDVSGGRETTQTHDADSGSAETTKETAENATATR